MWSNLVVSIMIATVFGAEQLQQEHGCVSGCCDILRKGGDACICIRPRTNFVLKRKIRVKKCTYCCCFCSFSLLCCCWESSFPQTLCLLNCIHDNNYWVLTNKEHFAYFLISGITTLPSCSLCALCLTEERFCQEAVCSNCPRCIRCQKGISERWNENCDWLINQQCVDQCGQRPELNNGVAQGDARPLLHSPPAQQQMGHGGEDPTCTVCLQDLVTIRVLPCNHKFHKECVETWLNQAPTRACPTCRADVPN